MRWTGCALWGGVWLCSLMSFYTSHAPAGLISVQYWRDDTGLDMALKSGSRNLILEPVAELPTWIMETMRWCTDLPWVVLKMTLGTSLVISTYFIYLIKRERETYMWIELIILSFTLVQFGKSQYKIWISFFTCTKNNMVWEGIFWHGSLRPPAPWIILSNIRWCWDK